MPNTPRYGLPYPVATDPLAGGAAAIQALAVAVDGKLPTTYRKITAKTVNNSTAETDLLNGEITLAAGVLGTDRIARFMADGDMFNNSGANQNPPRWKLKLGATTLFDTGTAQLAAWWGTNATRWPWSIEATIKEVGANTQSAILRLDLTLTGQSGSSPQFMGTPTSGVYGPMTQSGNIWVARAGNGSAEVTSAALPLVFSVILSAANGLVEVKLKTAYVDIV